MIKGTRILLCASLLAALLLLAGCAREAEQPAERAAAPTAAPAAPAVDPATAATLTGKVLYKDGQPQRVRLRMDADAACSRLHTGAVYTQDVVLNDNGTLRYAFVYVKEGPGNQAFPAPKQPVVLGAAAQQLYQTFSLQGHGGLDFSAIINLLRRDASA